MYLKNLRFDDGIINECINEMSDPITNREEFFNKLVMERLEEINQDYLRGFDLILSKLENKVASEESTLTDISKIITQLCKASKKSCRYELTLFNFLCGGDK